MTHAAIAQRAADLTQADKHVYAVVHESSYYLASLEVSVPRSITHFRYLPNSHMRDKRTLNRISLIAQQ